MIVRKEGKMSFEPQNKLEQSLIKASTDPAHRPQFYRDLVESDIYIIEHGPPPEKAGRTVLEEDYQLKIQPIEINGKPYLPVFSSLLRLQAVLQHEAGYIAMNALEFLKTTKGAEVVLNPGSEYRKEFTKEEIQSVIDGSIWQAGPYQIEEGTTVVFSQPSNYPHELAGALKGLFAGLKEVKRAYLALVLVVGKDEKTHTLIGIEVSENWDQVIAQASSVIQDIKVPDPPVDFTQITGKGGLGRDYFLSKCQPFYRKKILGLF